MEYETSNRFNDGKNPMVLNREAGYGGYSTTAFTYYSRGSGPVLEEDMPFENLVIDTGKDCVWNEALKIAGNCDKIEDNDDNSNPDIYDILRLIEFYFDNKVW